MASERTPRRPRRPLRQQLMHRVRRSRFLPAGVVDRVPDTHRLGRPLPGRVMVYLSTAQNSLYQLRQWYRPLRELDRRHGVSCVFRDSRTAAIARTESGLDCLTVGTVGQLGDILAVSDVRLALYVNLDPLVFEALRFTGPAHVYLGHGDSDKDVFASHQVCAFDYYFVAGQAAVDRLQAALPRWDAAAHCVTIGQPQLDDLDFTGRLAATPVAVYAPTWEGTGGIDGYSSLLYGTRIVDALHREGFRVVYRPHPFTGIEDAAYGRADTRVRDHVHRGGGRVDTEPGLQSAVAGAWALVTDVSGVVSSWLPSKRPLVVTSMTPAASRVDAGSLTAALRRVAPEEIDQLGRRLRETADVVDDDTLRYWLGDVSPGAPTAAFLEACTRVGGL